MKEKEFTCIVCPVGCHLLATIRDDGTVEDVRGNTCPRGAAYARAELTHPTRTLTSTVVVKNRVGVRLPVKTDKPVSKEKWKEAMLVLRDTVANAPIQVGDIIIDDFLGETHIVATAAIE